MLELKLLEAPKWEEEYPLFWTANAIDREENDYLLFWHTDTTNSEFSVKVINIRKFNSRQIHNIEKELDHANVKLVLEFEETNKHFYLKGMFK